MHWRVTYDDFEENLLSGGHAEGVLRGCEVVRWVVGLESWLVFVCGTSEMEELVDQAGIRIKANEARHVSNQSDGRQDH